jgi:hypothetical protein
MQDDLPFKVVRGLDDDEVLARCNSLLVGRAAYETAARQYANDLVLLCHGARIIEKSRELPPSS